MSITLIADRLQHRFGFVPSAPAKAGDQPAGAFKVHRGETFVWYGDQNDPPSWASPVDEAGRAMYAKAHQALDSETGAALARARKDVKRLEAEVVATPASKLAASNASLGYVRAEIARQEAVLSALPETEADRVKRERAMRVEPEAALTRLRAEEKRLVAEIEAANKNRSVTPATPVRPEPPRGLSPEPALPPTP